MQESTGSLLKGKYTLEREMQVNSKIELRGGSPDQRYLSPLEVEIGDIPLMWLLSFFPVGGNLSFPLSLPYLVPPGLLRHQVHDGNLSNCNVNDIIIN